MKPSPPSSANKLFKLFEKSDWPGLVAACRRTLRGSPADLMAHRLLGFALFKTDNTPKALEAFEQAVKRHPQDAELLINVGKVLVELALFSRAIDMLEAFCKLRPKHLEGKLLLCQAYYTTKHNQRGFEVAQEAYELAQSDHERSAALTQRSIHRRELGQIKEAIADCSEAIRLTPRQATNHHNRLLFLLSDPTGKPEEVYDAATYFSEIFETPFLKNPTSFAHKNRERNKKIRLGFLSPDIRMHAVTCYLEGTISQLNRDHFSLHAYYLYPTEDYITERLKNQFDTFVNISRTPTPEAFQQIIDDDIDILFDLAGHTGFNGLQITMRKAAPIQVSWMGFIGTIGLKSVDYFLTDPFLNPAQNQEFYVEKMVHFPSTPAVYRPMNRYPIWRYQPKFKIRETPALRNDFITFGSTNNLGKITDNTLAIWGELISSSEKFKIIIEGKSFDDPVFCNDYFKKLESHGINRSKVTLVPLDTNKQYLLYHDIDILLDPFPLTGGTTSFDSLWMGVPIVTLMGNAPQSRMTASILKFMDRSEWIASDTREYIHIAKQLASNATELNQIRQSLRDEFEHSVICDESRIGNLLGQHFRAMWLNWLDHESDTSAIESYLPEAEIIEASGLKAPAAVHLSSGKCISLSEAHQLLEKLTTKAREYRTEEKSSIDTHHWREATLFCEKILDSVPNDPATLTYLAEIEQAHGEDEFSVVYMEYALKQLSFMNVQYDTH